MRGQSHRRLMRQALLNRKTRRTGRRCRHVPRLRPQQWAKGLEALLPGLAGRAMAHLVGWRVRACPVLLRRAERWRGRVVASVREEGRMRRPSALPPAREERRVLRQAAAGRKRRSWATPRARYQRTNRASHLRFRSHRQRGSPLRRARRTAPAPTDAARPCHPAPAESRP
jgi:hypothetical protein